VKEGKRKGINAADSVSEQETILRKAGGWKCRPKRFKTAESYKGALRQPKGISKKAKLQLRSRDVLSHGIRGEKGLPDSEI